MDFTTLGYHLLIWILYNYWCCCCCCCCYIAGNITVAYEIKWKKIMKKKKFSFVSGFFFIKLYEHVRVNITKIPKNVHVWVWVVFVFTNLSLNRIGVSVSVRNSNYYRLDSVFICLFVCFVLICALSAGTCLNW